MKPKAILAYCREKGIRCFDLRYCDLDGNWRSISFPISSLSEQSFEEGFGQEVFLDASNGKASYSLLVPYSHANYLDPFTDQPTLVLVSAIQDVIQRQESSLDPRFVAAQSIRYAQSMGVADDVRIRTALRFGAGIEPSKATSGFHHSDELYLFRSNLTDRAIDAGVGIDRHWNHPSGVSEMILKSSSILEAGDDTMMLRYLIDQQSAVRQSAVHTQCYWSSSQWSFLRDEQPVFSGASYRGLSETGVHAQAGVLRHAESLACIFQIRELRDAATRFPYHLSSHANDEFSLCRSINDAQSPRALTLEVRGVPSDANHYLSYSALLMAMVDGIQNKMALPTFSGAQPLYKESTRLEAFEADCDYLARGDVFSDELLELIRNRMRMAV